MAGKVRFDQAGLEQIKLGLLQTASKLSEVANGAYVDQDMFPESRSEASSEMNGVRFLLAQCATMMYDCCASMAKFFQMVIEEVDEWDYEMALRSYLLGVENTVTSEVSDLGAGPAMPIDVDPIAYQQGQAVGVDGQIPNRPK